MKTILSLLTIATLMQFATASVEVGAAAPDFTGTADTGAEVKLSDQQGKYVILEWLNHGCPFVKKHYDSGNMQALQEKMAEAGVVWWSIVSSAKGKQGYMSPEASIAKREAIGAQPNGVILDADGTIGRLYDAKVTPHMYVIAPDGTLIYKGAIDSISSANPGDIEKAENYVKSAWKAHKNGENVDPESTRAYGCSIKYAK